MIIWIFILFLISVTSAIFAFGGFAAEIAILAKISFLTFSVLFIVALFVYLGTKKAMKEKEKFHQ